MAGGVEFEPSLEVLQVVEIKRFIGGVFLCICSGAFNKGSLTDSESSRKVFSKGGLKVPLLSGASEKRATGDEIISSERGSLVEVLAGIAGKLGTLSISKLLIIKYLTRWRRERDSNPRYPFRYNGFQDRRYQPLTHPSAGERPLSVSLPHLDLWRLGARLQFSALQF